MPLVSKYFYGRLKVGGLPLFRQDLIWTDVQKESSDHQEIMATIWSRAYGIIFCWGLFPPQTLLSPGYRPISPEICHQKLATLSNNLNIILLIRHFIHLIFLPIHSCYTVEICGMGAAAIFRNVYSQSDLPWLVRRPAGQSPHLAPPFSQHTWQERGKVLTSSMTPMGIIVGTLSFYHVGKCWCSLSLSSVIYLS